MQPRQSIMPIISASIIIFTEAIPLNFVEGLNQLLYVVAFLLSFSMIELIKFISSKYFTRIFLPFFAFVLLQFIIGKYFKDEYEFIFTFPYYYSFSSFTLLYVFFRIRTSEGIQKLSKILLGFLMFNAIFGLFNFLIGEPFSSIRLILSAGKEGWLYFGKGDRIAGLAPTLFHYGYQVVLLPVILFSLYLWKNKSIYLALAIVGLFVVIMNGERAALGAVLLVVALIVRHLKIRIRVFPLLLAFLTFFVTISFFQDDLLSENSSLARVSDEDSDVEKRFIKMGSALQTVFNNPFTGGTVYEYERHYAGITGKYPSSPHNTYINVGRSGGFIGFFLLFVFLTNIFKIIRRTSRRINTNYKELYIGFMYSFIAILAVGFFHNGGVFTKEPWTWILIGFLISFHGISEKNSVNNN